MTLIWSRIAVEDRIRIFEYIEVDNPIAAIGVDERVEARTKLLLRFPNAGRARLSRSVDETLRHCQGCACRRGIAALKENTPGNSVLRVATSCRDSLHEEKGRGRKFER